MEFAVTFGGTTLCVALFLFACWRGSFKGRAHAGLDPEEEAGREAWRKHPALRRYGGLAVCVSAGVAVAAAIEGLMPLALWSGGLALAGFIAIHLVVRRTRARLRGFRRINEWG